MEDQKLVLQTQPGALSLALKRIVKIEGERNYSFIQLADNTIELFSKTLAYFENILNDKGFFRGHCSCLVNRFPMDRISAGTFVLEDNSPLPISRRRLS